uniref:HDC07554 n=1 Tax=Drosophila melanogaster TaxID=7227 RepID=Q6IM39_DROME|nr:TPA_inf: HDC07554 [Drosophila melanogaster]
MSSKHKWTRLLLICLIVLLNHTASPLAKHVTLRPLELAEIRSLQNSISKGRSVSSGLAAITGFALGLGKALTGVFIYDVITANITESEDTVQPV